jgi:hypothetical protein
VIGTIARKEGVFMRRVVSIIAAGAALGGGVGGTVIFWRRNPRVGAAFVNSVVNPGLIRRGLAGGAASEIGTLEHVGRRSGTRRLTPVHPEPTLEGFRVVVPLGRQSEWARNVLSAGHCRLQLHGLVYDLDEPAMIPASEVGDLPRIVRGVMAALGFQYLKLRTFGENEGILEPADDDAFAVDPPAPGHALAPDHADDLVSSAV